HMAAALAGWRDLAKGLGWQGQLRRAGVRHIKSVASLRALGGERLSEIEYTLRSGRTERQPASVLLAHEGVVPSIHMTRALECRHHWNPVQACLAPDVDEWGQTSQPGVYVAGDGAGIGGARSACIRGELTAIGIALAAGRFTSEQALARARPLRERLAAELRLRPLLDALYPPRASVFAPSDDTVVCRCEELTAGDIRQAAAVGRPGPNQIKSITRAGMGPCQGRQCGYTIAHILAQAQDRPVAEVGFYRIRPPLKPLTLGELASLDSGDSAS
ncbi:(2Fe-2S)-binding protein, partial [Bordetella petrii]|uniref:(2Fe-2S)-binding protein n=1 Tax=Bordetella petrii TaxID=94624 RepID=UPI001E28AAFF